MGFLRHASQDAFTGTRQYGTGRPRWMAHEHHARLYAGNTELTVVGESGFQENLWALVGRTTDRVNVEAIGVLVPETDHPHDPEAIGVWIQGLQVGYLSGPDAHYLRHEIIGAAESTGRAVAVSATISGGGLRRDHEVGNLEVFLRFDPVALEVVGTWGTTPAL